MKSYKQSIYMEQGRERGREAEVTSEHIKRERARGLLSYSVEKEL